MRKIILYIAMSLDGYIADESGNVDWLNGDGSEKDNQGTYNSFIKGIDTVLIGYNTYSQIISQLSPDKWVYEGMKSYIFTHKKMENKNDIEFTSKTPLEIINKLKKTDGKNIWICGGASIVQNCIKEDLIDEYYIAIIPVILGSGIKLFSENKKKILLKYRETINANGIEELRYERR